MLQNPHYFLFEPFEKLKGIGKSFGEYFAKLVAGNRVFDLLLHFPSNIEKVNIFPNLYQVYDQELVMLKGIVESHQKPAKSSQPYKIICYNPTGYFSLVFFKIYPSQIEKLAIGKEIVVMGKIQKHLKDNQISHPQYVEDISKVAQIPQHNVIYPLSQKISNKFVAQKIQEILTQLPKSCEEWISDNIVKEHDFPTFYNSLRLIHNPIFAGDINPQNPAYQRLAYDEILASQIAVLLAKKRQKKSKSFNAPFDNLGQKFIDSLPFQLTNAQCQAIKDIDQSPRGAAADWLYSKRRGVGSMRWICDMLDLDYYKLLNLCMTRAGRAVILKKDRRRNPDKRKKKTMEEEE